MKDIKEKLQIDQKDYEPPKIVEKKTVVIDLYSDEPPVAPPWPGP